MCNLKGLIRTNSQKMITRLYSSPSALQIFLASFSYFFLFLHHKFHF